MVGPAKDRYFHLVLSGKDVLFKRFNLRVADKLLTPMLYRYLVKLPNLCGGKLTFT